MRLRFVICAALLVAGTALGAACDRGGDGPARGEAPGGPAGEEAGEGAGERADEAREILDQLEASDASVEQRLEAIHRAREARIESAAPTLRELLSADEPDIVVASAAALEQIDPEAAEGEIVSAAARLSRQRQHEHLRQLLYILGDLDGPQANTYLEAVADGHEVPQIRRTAAHILER